MLYTAAVLVGALVGLLMQKCTALMIKKRMYDNELIQQPVKNHTFIFCILIYSLLFLLAALLGGISILTIKFVLIGTIYFSLSAVDIKTRKIPNELLLTLIVVQVISLVIYWNIDTLLASIGGMVTGLLLFILPSLIGKAAGLGDVKLAATTGFMLGFHGLLVAVIIMALFISIYTVYLMTTKKGGLKTKLALGPYITAGTVAVMIINILSNTSYLDLSRLIP